MDSTPNCDVDIDQGWARLKDGLDLIYAEVFENMPKEKYMELYTHVYDCCAKKDFHGAGVRRTANCYSQELYDKLSKFLSCHISHLLKKNCDLTGEPLLATFARLWEKYRFSSKVLNGICSYLNRNWVLREIQEGKKGVYMVYQLAVVLWRDSIFFPLNASITRAVLKLIERDRGGENINYGLISRIINCYVEYGLNEEDPLQRRETLDVYSKLFEGAFLHDTESYYIRESACFLKQNSVSEYIKKVEVTLLNEEMRVRLYLHDSTLGPLSRICEHVLIQKHVELLYSEFQTLLHQDKYEDLERMYGLVSLVPGGLKELRNFFENHVFDQGLSAIEMCAESALHDPVLFFETIMRVYRKNRHLVATSFGNDIGFSSGLDKACEKFINHNAVTRLANYTNKSPQLLAQYCDFVLRRNPRSPEESELEEVLSEIMEIFKYVKDKDVFQKFYGKYLGNRLINGTSSSDHMEACMLYKLRELCGFEYTYRLQRLYLDIDLSKGINERFQEYVTGLGRHLSLDCNIKVLSEGFWPNAEDGLAFSLPQELEEVVTTFTEFYGSQHSGRKLRWLYNKSKGELVTNCYSSKYTLQASTFQMAILLQYNAADSFTVAQLQQAIQIEKEPLCRCIKGLLNQKLLILSESCGEVNESSLIALSLDYKSRKLRVNINVPTKADSKLEDETTYKNLEVERSFLIQATIVRIMKMRKVLRHRQLISEVLSHLSSKFKPSIQHIKKCINILIEKEYLKRTEGDKEAYQYLV